MNYKIKNLPIQKLANGSKLTVQAYIFKGNKPGPKIYLQGNLHGPEVFGTALLLELIQAIKKMKKIRGELIVVPCANPMGVNQVSYNSMIGRYNHQSGVNWNRIFPILLQNTLKFTAQRETVNLSIESKLAATLHSLSSGSDYVLDIHTTGISSVEHLFTYSWMHKEFSALNVPIHLTLDTKNVVGAFDESHVIPFLKSLPLEKITKVATWEAHCNSDIDNKVLKQRLSQMLNWLAVVWNEKQTQMTKIEIYSKYSHLYAPIAGYYSWITKVGDKVKKGEIYAFVYNPLSDKIMPIKAKFSFILLGIYGIPAIANGEQIGWIALT